LSRVAEPEESFQCNGCLSGLFCEIVYLVLYCLVLAIAAFLLTLRSIFPKFAESTDIMKFIVIECECSDILGEFVCDNIYVIAL